LQRKSKVVKKGLSLFKETHESNRFRQSSVVSTADELFAATSRFLASSKLSESNMQRRVFNSATIEVANNRDISGRATADEMNTSLRTGKSKLRRIARSTFLGSLMVAGFLVALAPLSARADNDEDARHGRGDNDREIRAEITALKTQVADLQNQVNTLQSQLAHAKNVLALDPFVRVDPNPEIGVIGPNIIFSGVNIHIVSGSGVTNDNGNPRGLGNLIIGYDESPDSTEGGSPLNSGDRGGSHNLVIGPFNRFTQAAFGGLVAGEFNTIQSLGASVTGGANNTASGFGASVSGGLGNTASGGFASVSGQGNTASGFEATVSGGLGNTASGGFASVSGGRFNIASGDASSALGGIGNTAGGMDTVVIGGRNVTANNNNLIAPQPPFP
jgi:hypothetical protein